MDFVCMKKKYGNEWVSLFVELGILELVRVIFLCFLTQNEGLRDLWNL